MKEEENKVASKHLCTNLFNVHGNANLNQNEDANSIYQFGKKKMSSQGQYWPGGGETLTGG